MLSFCFNIPKGIVHIKMKIVILYSPSCCLKLEGLLFFHETHIKIFSRIHNLCKVYLYNNKNSSQKAIRRLVHKTRLC